MLNDYICLRIAKHTVTMNHQRHVVMLITCTRMHAAQPASPDRCLQAGITACAAGPGAATSCALAAHPCAPLHRMRTSSSPAETHARHAYAEPAVVQPAEEPALAAAAALHSSLCTGQCSLWHAALQ